MIRKIKRFLTTIMTIAITATMMMGNSIQVRADDSEYNFLYKPLDTEFYATYPDLAAIANDPYALWRHYMEHGMAEGRIPYLGAQPGEFVDGYTEPNANATVATGADNTVTQDLSDWTPAQLAMLAQKQAEFDASGLVHVSWSEKQVQEKLLSLKSVYPENMSVGVCWIGAGSIESALYGTDADWLLEDEQGLLLCDKAGMRVMPIGYVKHKEVQRIDGGNIRDIRVGDVLYTEGAGGHVQVVLSHDDRGITVVESNINGDEKFHWGRHISWNELENGGRTIYQQQNKWIYYVHYLY